MRTAVPEQDPSNFSNREAGLAAEAEAGQRLGQPGAAVIVGLRAAVLRCSLEGHLAHHPAVMAVTDPRRAQEHNAPF